jgi:predicted esterase
LRIEVDVRSRLRIVSGVLALASLGCASLGAENKPKLSVADLSTDELKPVPFSEETGVAPYTFAGAAQKVEWIDCKVKGTPQATLLLMHRDRAGWETGKYCGGWIAQSFLSQGFDVVAVNRPGYGQSTGEPDFAGAQSLAAVDAGVKAALAQAKNAKPLTGIWGYSTGATAAALYAKHAGNFAVAILGGGVYDFEETLKGTQDDYLKKDIEQIKKTGGSKALEDRSIGYDVSGLPKVIAVYHGKSDATAPLAQAQAFADSLASNGAYKVTFQPLEGVTHEIPWPQHWKILEVLAHAAANGG